jgi:hypothetical protein
MSRTRALAKTPLAPRIGAADALICDGQPCQGAGATRSTLLGSSHAPMSEAAMLFYGFSSSLSTGLLPCSSVHLVPGSCVEGTEPLGLLSAGERPRLREQHSHTWNGRNRSSQTRRVGVRGPFGDRGVGRLVGSDDIKVQTCGCHDDARTGGRVGWVQFIVLVASTLCAS